MQKKQRTKQNESNLPQANASSATRSYGDVHRHHPAPSLPCILHHLRVQPTSRSTTSSSATMRIRVSCRLLPSTSPVPHPARTHGRPSEDDSLSGESSPRMGAESFKLLCDVSVSPRLSALIRVVIANATTLTAQKIEEQRSAAGEFGLNHVAQEKRPRRSRGSSQDSAPARGTRTKPGSVHYRRL